MRTRPSWDERSPVWKPFRILVDKGGYTEDPLNEAV